MNQDVSAQVLEPARMDLIETDAGNVKLCFEDAHGCTVTIALAMNGLLELSNTLDKFIVGKTLDAVPPSMPELSRSCVLQERVRI